VGQLEFRGGVKKGPANPGFDCAKSGSGEQRQYDRWRKDHPILTKMRYSRIAGGVIFARTVEYDGTRSEQSFIRLDSLVAKLRFWVLGGPWFVVAGGDLPLTHSFLICRWQVIPEQGQHPAACCGSGGMATD
jgi:hypothetical protein